MLDLGRLNECLGVLIQNVFSVFLMDYLEFEIIHLLLILLRLVHLLSQLLLGFAKLCLNHEFLMIDTVHLILMLILRVFHHLHQLFKPVCMRIVSLLLLMIVLSYGFFEIIYLIRLGFKRLFYKILMAQDIVSELVEIQRSEALVPSCIQCL